MGEDAAVAETDALDHGLLRLSARVVVPLTVRWDTASTPRPAAPPRDQRLQELLAVLRGVLRAHIAPTGGLDVAGAADAWCFVNAGDGHRFYYRFVEAPRFRVYTRASTHTAGGGMGEDGGTDTDAVYEACTVAARELVVLMTDDREPRDISDPAGAGAAGAVNVISRYFGLSFLCLLVDVCVCAGTSRPWAAHTVQDEDEGGGGGDGRKRAAAPPSRVVVDKSRKERKRRAV